ncbi:hypothetical protein COCNU_08G009210 [Cocos nucifera]|uniref:Uncharacterized protein n=1 Tax=Cocos nucifera TaxID=13894 RepID=A0A8K0N6K1_COCNU|nr:hypothetical protein COCNU_08G009210 [Cocos nucifera]
MRRRRRRRGRRRWPSHAWNKSGTPADDLRDSSALSSSPSRSDLSPLDFRMEEILFLLTIEQPRARRTVKQIGARYHQNSNSRFTDGSQLPFSSFC